METGKNCKSHNRLVPGSKPGEPVSFLFLF